MTGSPFTSGSGRAAGGRHPAHLVLLLALIAFALGRSNAPADDVARGIVRVIAIEHGQPMGHGTGFCVSAEGHIVTNQHVVAEGDRFVAVARIGSRVRVARAEVQWSDEGMDLALLRTSLERMEPWVLGVREPEPGEQVRALGFPGIADDEEDLARMMARVEREGLSDFEDTEGTFIDITTPELITGHVRSVKTERWPVTPDEFLRWLQRNRSPEQVRRMSPDQQERLYRSVAASNPEIRVINHDVNFSPGNSGGPLIDACGRVIGVNTVMTQEGAVLLRKSSHVGALVEQLRNNGLTPAVDVDDCMPDEAPPSRATLLASAVSVSVACLALAVAYRRRAEVVRACTRLTQAFTRVIGRGSGRGARARRSDLMAAAAAPWELGEIEGDRVPAGSVRLTIAPQDLAGDGRRLILGRRPGLADLVVSHASVSRQHAVLRSRGRVLEIQDRNSENGTFVDGRRLSPFEWVELQPGAVVTVGEVRLRLADGAGREGGVSQG